MAPTLVLSLSRRGAMVHPTRRFPLAAPHTSAGGERPMSPLNLAVLVGALSRVPEARLLADGCTVWELDVTIRHEGRPPATVPVSWPH
ncbi:MAG TPA: hypothetical protein VM386_00915, partial [Acidimicrobiales bacterium]|nr:hypothetical protein [Acidimicrobiales bacterium]